MGQSKQPPADNSCSDKDVSYMKKTDSDDLLVLK